MGSHPTNAANLSNDWGLPHYKLPQQHHKHMKSTNMLERLNEEIKRRTHVVRIFPNPETPLVVQI